MQQFGGLFFVEFGKVMNRKGSVARAA